MQINEIIKKKLSVEEKAGIAYEAAVSKKALDVVCLDVSGLTSIADYFMICGASSTRQVSAVSDEIQKCLRKKGVKNYHVEGKTGDRWILLDFGDIVIHIFHEEARSHYDLERLWGDAPRVNYKKQEKE